MALRRLSYYKKFLHLDMAILLKTNIAYYGLILGIRERDLVFQVNQKIFYQAQGQYNVLHHRLNVLEIVYINPNNVMVYRLGPEPPIAYLPVRREIVCDNSLQGHSMHFSNLPYFALPEEHLEQELPNPNASLPGNNANSSVQTVDNTDGIDQEICTGAEQELNEVDREIKQEKPNNLEMEEKIETNRATTTMTTEFENYSDPENHDSSSQYLALEPDPLPSTSKCTSLNNKNNRFGKNPLVEKYESYRKSKLL